MSSGAGCRWLVAQFPAPLGGWGCGFVSQCGCVGGSPGVRCGAAPRRGVSVLGLARGPVLTDLPVLTRQPLRADTPRHVALPPYAADGPLRRTVTYL